MKISFEKEVYDFLKNFYKSPDIMEDEQVKPNLEFELRFTDGRNCDQSVPLKDVRIISDEKKRLIENFLTTQHLPIVKEISKVEVYGKYRKITTGDVVKYETKQRVRPVLDIEYKDFMLRFALSSETPISNLDIIRNEPDEIRTRNRVEFKSNYYTYVLTEINSTKEPNHYEFEIEFDIYKIKEERLELTTFVEQAIQSVLPFLISPSRASSSTYSPCKDKTSRVTDKLDNIIYLDDPENKLSPEYPFKINIENEKSDNIISYAYAGIVSSKSGVRLNILKTPARQASIIALGHLKNEQQNIFTSSLFHSLNFLSEQQKKNLLETGDATLVYEDKDSLLKENVGKVYMDFRDKLKNRIFSELRETKDTLKMVHIMNEVYKKLLELIVSGQNDLKRFEGQTASSIAKELNIDYEMTMYKGQTREGKESMISELLKELSPFIDIIPSEQGLSTVQLLQKHYKNIAYFLRQKYKENFEKKSMDTFKLSLIEYHISHVVGKDYESRNEFLKLIGSDGLEELKERLKYLYLLSRDTFLPHLPKGLEPKMITNSVYSPIYTTQPLYMKPGYNADKTFYMQVEPIFMEVESIRKIVYETPLHYAYSKMLEHFADEKASIQQHREVRITDLQAHSIISKYNIINLSTIYKSFYDRHILFSIKYRLEKALKIKFKNEPFRSLLLLSKPKKLIYESFDIYLGTGKIKNGHFNGKNEVGMTMMKIRDEIKGDAINVEDEGVKEKESFSQILDGIFQNENTNDVKSWLTVQTKDIFNIIVNLKIYLKNKFNLENNNISEEEIIFVIENIYSVCHLMEKIIDIQEFRQIQIKGVPEDFKNIINKILSSNNLRISPSGIKKIWSYILLLTLSIKKDGGFTISNFSSEIRKVAKKRFKEVSCTRNKLYNIHELKESMKATGMINIEKIQEKEYKNCIYQAALNLLDKLRTFSYQFSEEGSFIVNPVDIELIYNIMSYYSGEELSPIKPQANSDSDYLTIYNNLSSSFKISSSVSNYFTDMINTLLTQSDNTKQRIIYFAEESADSKEKIKKKTKRALEQDKLYEEWRKEREEKQRIEDKLRQAKIRKDAEAYKQKLQEEKEQKEQKQKNKGKPKNPVPEPDEEEYEEDEGEDKGDEEEDEGDEGDEEEDEGDEEEDEEDEEDEEKKLRKKIKKLNKKISKLSEKKAKAVIKGKDTTKLDKKIEKLKEKLEKKQKDLK